MYTSRVMLICFFVLKVTFLWACRWVSMSWGITPGVWSRKLETQIIELWKSFSSIFFFPVSKFLFLFEELYFLWQWFLQQTNKQFIPLGWIFSEAKRKFTITCMTDMENILSEFVISWPSEFNRKVRLLFSKMLIQFSHSLGIQIYCIFIYWIGCY